ncbi:TIR domain-containing protein [Paucibacter sp. APW11]|uniref:TIR domain-containing protein n=1 Tax=Roseateles aquae TaxID=3077235 RepID=A0ABU3PDI3_9BURK|nr:TIR domain-containing protein [Paucibacter sp. APW11]MDT9000178.1 TIR domain-containing protein [Paucibacter sp. APW11]
MRVFISYSWDSVEHKQWVQQLADDLQEQVKDLDVTYDQRGMNHRVDRNQFMEAGIYESDAVLAIITQKYTDKANTRVGGVGRETAMAAERHFSESGSKSRTPILAIKREATADLPHYLKASLYFDFTSAGAYNASLEELKRELEAIAGHASEQSPSTKVTSDEGAADEGGSYSFTRTDDLLASLYKRRTPLWAGQDFSGQRRVKYELWRVEAPQPQLLLVLMQNIIIRQIFEDFLSKIRDLPKDLQGFRELTVLRPSPGKSEYIAELLKEGGHDVRVTESPRISRRLQLWRMEP